MIHCTNCESLRNDRIQTIPDGSFVVVYSDNPMAWHLKGEVLRAWRDKGLCGGLIVRSDEDMKIMSDEDLRQVGLMRVPRGT